MDPKNASLDGNNAEMYDDINDDDTNTTEEETYDNDITNINKQIYMDTIVEFEKICKSAETGEDIFKIASNYYKLFKSGIFCKSIYNKYIGWALPIKETCEMVVDTWKLFPHKKIVDFGAGTGLFCKVFNYLGIPEEKLLAIDRIKPSHNNPKNKCFWTINHDDDYKVDIDDILFIAWGSCDNYVIDNYVTRGGTCVIILGEEWGGCTLSSDYFLVNHEGKPDDFMKNDGWDIKVHNVPGPASYYSEKISINIKY